jgi:ABC transport system ATP-binding/permease protein
MWRLTIDDDQAKRTVVELAHGEYTIGRAPDNTVRLTDRNISRHHARLVRDDSSWVLIDLDSYNGCFASGERLKSRYVLSPGETVVIGDYRLKVSDAAEDSVLTPESNATMPAQRSSQTPQPEDRLVILSGLQPGMQFPLRTTPLSVGRGEECDIRLDDTSVSRVHVALNPLADGVFQVKDEASSNGLRINGREVSEAVLTPGDVLELGDVELVFVPRGQAFNPQGFRKRAPTGLLPRLRHNPRLALSAVGGAILFGAALLALSTTGGGVAEQTKSPAANALDLAELQLNEGQIEVAHETLKVIGEESNLRQSARFRDIEARWAEDQFQRAQRAQEASEERQILQRIAQAPGVDSARRKRAAELLALLSQSDLQPSDLPRAGADAGVSLATEPDANEKPSHRAGPNAKAVPSKKTLVIDLDSTPASAKPPRTASPTPDGQ